MIVFAWMAMNWVIGPSGRTYEHVMVKCGDGQRKWIDDMRKWINLGTCIYTLFWLIIPLCG